MNSTIDFIRKSPRAQPLLYVPVVPKMQSIEFLKTPRCKINRAASRPVLGYYRKGKEVPSKDARVYIGFLITRFYIFLSLVIRLGPRKFVSRFFLINAFI